MPRSASWSASALLAITCLTRVGLADDGAMLKQMDATVEKSVVQTINAGVPVFNRGDAAGCYWTYRGAVVAMEPILAYRPEVQAMVKQGLAKADTLGTYAERAVALRDVLDGIRSKVMPAPAGGTTLWSRLGGESAVKAVVHDFVVKAAGDPAVDFTRGGKYALDAAGVANLEKLIVELVSAVSGGPLKYTGRSMKESHAGMMITEAQFNASAADLIAVLKSYKVPEKEINELVGIIATTKKDIVEDPSIPKPLWDRLGGEPAVKAVVRDFVVKAAGDPAVDFTRGGKYPIDAAGVANLEKLLVELISATTGGPFKYTGKSMKESHAGMMITEEQFNATAADLITVLKSYKVPQKEIDELIAIVATTKKDIVEPAK